MDDHKFIALMDKISEVGERVAKVEERVNAVGDRVGKVEELDLVQNRLLAEHIQGTTTNRQRLEVEIKNRTDLESRVSKLEEVPKFLTNLKKVLKYIVTIGGATAIIYKWFH